MNKKTNSQYIVTVIWLTAVGYLLSTHLCYTYTTTMYQPHKKPFQFWLVHSCHRRLTWIELRRRRGTNALRDIKLNRVCSCIVHTHYMYLPIGLKSKNQSFHDKFALIRKLCWQYYIYFSLPNIISTKKKINMLWHDLTIIFFPWHLYELYKY